MARSLTSCATSASTKVTKGGRKGGDTRAARCLPPDGYNKGLYTIRATLLLQLDGSSVPYDFTTLQRHVAFRLS